MLKAMGVMDRPSVGAVDAEEVKRIQEMEERKMVVARLKEETEVEMQEAFPGL
jgi:hypothetical protein